MKRTFALMAMGLAVIAVTGCKTGQKARLSEPATCKLVQTTCSQDFVNYTLTEECTVDTGSYQLTYFQAPTFAGNSRLVDPAQATGCRKKKADCPFANASPGAKSCCLVGTKNNALRHARDKVCPLCPSVPVQPKHVPPYAFRGVSKADVARTFGGADYSDMRTNERNWIYRVSTLEQRCVSLPSWVEPVNERTNQSSVLWVVFNRWGGLEYTKWSRGYGVAD